MRLFNIEHSRRAYRADFALYGLSCLLLSAILLLAGPPEQSLRLLGLAVAGLAGWTLLEYVLHRFVLHGLPPFKRWHAEHHRRPRALICTPTLLSATLVVSLVFVPALLLGDWWQACALTVGLLSGYLIYALTHHALHHHGRSGQSWLQRRRLWHALHHGSGHTLQHQPGHYGVTSAFWDHVFGSAENPR
ncbi:sterol desaturase family protein [Paucibacter sp. O1-1]|uniref:sterol desaturase family protein n=1 Tax=Paucibacter sp. M5-1 TaxID=3015998 RepID=UPI0021D4D218|nr:sterol desaturase family protein [Paucibacter sp. M5-1]MCU7372606.1 sterol desaturase family protein [Paucibacter sp. O1-1]MCZ7882852.1 sterol desaturase family protein [Paucibacter sp. M5-1]MDA3827600.1 sterol desaturase family protein [Paucibacter sp. O1-1]